MCVTIKHHSYYKRTGLKQHVFLPCSSAGQESDVGPSGLKARHCHGCISSGGSREESTEIFPVPASWGCLCSSAHDPSHHLPPPSGQVLLMLSLAPLLSPFSSIYWDPSGHRAHPDNPGWPPHLKVSWLTDLTPPATVIPLCQVTEHIHRFWRLGVDVFVGGCYSADHIRELLVFCKIGYAVFYRVN